jgi:hypothetical protein
MSWLTSVEPVARSHSRRCPVWRRINQNTVTSMSCAARKAVIEPTMIHRDWRKTLLKEASSTGEKAAARTWSHTQSATNA